MNTASADRIAASPPRPAPPPPPPPAPSRVSGREVVDRHTQGDKTDVQAVAQDLRNEIRQRPNEATKLTKEALEQVKADDRDELAQEFVRAHSDSELKALGSSAAGKGALALSVNELTKGKVHKDEADDARRVGTALGTEIDVKVNAGWSWERASGAVHTVLDIAGFIPGLGAIPDLINAGIYAAEGDKLNAGLSLGAAVPIVGDAAKGTSMVVKGGKEVLEAGAKKAVREGAEAAGEKAVKEGLEAAGTKGANEAVQGGAKHADDAAPPPTGGSKPPGGSGQPGMPDGLSYRTDLPQHLAGPHGFKGQALHGTHNVDNAVAELKGRGLSYRVEPTGTKGISELKYDVVKSDGTVKTYSKTVYDPKIYSDAKMLDLAQAAGEKGYAAFKNNPSGPATFDIVEGGVNMRVYINKTPEGVPFVGNVHPIQP
jgi:hypothetical protein